MVTSTVKAEITNEQGYLVIHFSGEIDFNAKPHARDVILNCLNLRRNTLLDLSSVTYIDSSGIASFIEAYKFAHSIKLPDEPKQENALEFGLRNISDPVIKVLKLARLDETFPVYNSPG